MEFKVAPNAIKDIDSKQGIVTGYPATFNVLDDGNDVILPGAFKRTINAWGPSGKNRIKALFMHEPAWLVGKPLVMYEDSKGLYWEVQFSMRNSMAKDTFYLIEDGVITEQSIGYDPVQKEIKDGIRHLTELKLFEGSYVVWGMNSETPITGTKSIGSERKLKSLTDSMAKFEKALRNGHFHTEEVPEMIDLALKKWREAIKHWEEELSHKEQQPSQREVITINSKEVQTPFELKLRDFTEVSSDMELRNRGWQLMDALYWAVDEIRYEHGKDDNVPDLLAHSIDQFKKAMVDWATEAQKAGVFYASPDVLTTEFTADELKTIIPGLFSFAQKLYDAKALSGKVDSGDTTSLEGDSPKDNDHGDSGDHSLEVKELLAPLTGLKHELQSKQLLSELRDFGKSLRGDN